MIEPRTAELLRPHGLAEAILTRGARNGVCEFRADGEVFVLDYGASTNGQGHYVYPQHDLVHEWADQLRAARLPVVWQYEEFSNFMLGLPHAGHAPAEPASPRPVPADGSAFAHGLRWARLNRVLNDPRFSRWFAHAHAGVDP